MDTREFLPLDLIDIPQFFKKKAECELNETEENVLICINTLKELLKEEKKFIVDTSDAFLIRFLRAKKFNCQKAFNLIKKYYAHRQKYPNIYQDFNPLSVLHVMRENTMTFLPYRTKDGCAIWVSRFGDWDTSNSKYEETLKFGLMCLETVSKYSCTQISGVVNILDLRNLSYRQVIELTPKRIFCFVSAVQDGFPLRQRSTHVVYEPTIFSIFFRLFSPLLKEKHKERIKVHGHNMKSLHKHIPAEILPEEYGGTLGPLKTSDFYESILKCGNEFEKIQDFGYVS